MASIEELVERLEDFRTRSAAKRELIEMGEKAVKPLVKALGNPFAGARWAAASVLGSIGSKEAAPALVEALKDSEISGAAAEALARITGQSFGEDAEAWQRHLEGAAAPGEPATPEELTDADLVAHAVYGTDISANERPPGYVLGVPLGDRHQDALVNFRAKDSEGVPLVVIYTRCGRADPKHYEWALKQNVKMSAGAIALAEIEGESDFVVVDVLVRPSTTPEILLESVRRVAKKGDQLEAALSKADEY